MIFQANSHSAAAPPRARPGRPPREPTAHKRPPAREPLAPAAVTSAHRCWRAVGLPRVRCINQTSGALRAAASASIGHNQEDNKRSDGSVRHARILGLCLVAAFAMSAVAAVPALAKKAHVPGTLEGEWAVYKDCPLNNPEFTNPATEFDGKTLFEPTGFCIQAHTAGGKEGGHFTVGAVTVPLSKPVTLQGGVIFYNGPESAEGHFFAAEGGETLASPELTVPKGINLITPAIQAAAGWPRALEESFDYAKLHKETALKAKISVAGGNLLYEETDALSTQNLIEERGSAFTLPLKVTLSGPWLQTLGGGPCTVGSETHPVVQHLTSGTSEAPFPFEGNTAKGEVTGLTANPAFSNITLHSKLVDSTWPVETEAEGCGGAFESYVDVALNKVLEIPAPAGKSTTVLTGTLHSGNGGVVKSESETGEE